MCCSSCDANSRSNNIEVVLIANVQATVALVVVVPAAAVEASVAVAQAEAARVAAAAAAAAAAVSAYDIASAPRWRASPWGSPTKDNPPTRAKVLQILLRVLVRVLSTSTNVLVLNLVLAL